VNIENFSILAPTGVLNAISEGIFAKLTLDMARRAKERTAEANRLELAKTEFPSK
jgi:hypothetical protein